MTPEAEIEAGIRQHADPVRALDVKRYLKSDLAFLGAPVPMVRTAVRSAIAGRCPGLDRAAALGLARSLWISPLWELRLAAVEVLTARWAVLETGDLELVEELLRSALTWALVDPLSAEVAARLFERDRAGGGSWLDRWAVDPNLWLRRASLLTLLPGLRRGEGDFERFGRYADPMLEERDFFIRKAIGWVLRETGRRRPDVVRAWLGPRAARASGLTLREAVRHLPGHRL